MTMYDRLANYNNHGSWDIYIYIYIETAKTQDLEFNLPNYMLATKPQQFMITDVLPTLRQMNFKLIVDNDKVMLTRNIQSDIIATSDIGDEIEEK